MLVIRDEQMAALDAERERRFSRWLAASLRESDPEAVGPLTGSQVLQRVRRALARARRYGIEDALSLYDFVAATFRQADDFDQHPQVRAVLEDPAIPPAARMEELFARVPAEVWRELRARGRAAGRAPRAGGAGAP